MCFEGWPLTERQDETQSAERDHEPEEPAGPLPRPSLKLTGIFLTVIAVGLILAWAFRPAGSDVAEIGSRAPDFTVPLFDGGEFTLSDHFDESGQPVVLNLWASWCAPCRIEIPEISEFATAHPDVKVIGVAVEDTEEAARALAAELSPSYDLGFGDPEFDVAYPRLGLPVTYVIDGNGTVAEAFNGIVNLATLEDLVFG